MSQSAPIEKKKFPREEALAVGVEILSHLHQFCERGQIAGSIRREKPFVGDVEILFVPKTSARKVDFFTSSNFDCAAEKIEALIASGFLSKRKNKNGLDTWGRCNKLAIHTASGIPVDLFSVSAENWFMSLVIRTGPKELNLRLIDGAAFRGLKLHAYGTFTDCEGNKVACGSEEEVFELCGVPYLPANKRI